MQTLYVDVLFFINFFMDGLSLYLTGSIMHFPHRSIRIAISAAVGAAYAVADVLFPGNAVISALIGILLSGLLVQIAFPEKSPKRFLGACLAFYGISILLGGAVTVFYSLLSRFVGENTAPPARSDVILTLAGLSGVLVALGVRFFRRRNVGEQMQISVEIDGNPQMLTALVDSGNLLSDPLSGKPVILCGKRATSLLFPQGIPMPDNDTNIFLRPVFVQGAEGRRMLWAFAPRKLALLEKRGASSLSAVIALDEHTEKYGDCDALMPSSLLL